MFFTDVKFFAKWGKMTEIIYYKQKDILTIECIAQLALSEIG